MFFEKYFSSNKIWTFSENFHFYVFIVSHVQPLRVASRNSHCAARGRDKRAPENPENPENPPNCTNRITIWLDLPPLKKTIAIS